MLPGLGTQCSSWLHSHLDSGVGTLGHTEKAGGGLGKGFVCLKNENAFDKDSSAHRSHFPSTYKQTRGAKRGSHSLLTCFAVPSFRGAAFSLRRAGPPLSLKPAPRCSLPEMELFPTPHTETPLMSPPPAGTPFPILTSPAALSPASPGTCCPTQPPELYFKLRHKYRSCSPSSV